jgi:hypothetical protein
MKPSLIFYNDGEFSGKTYDMTGDISGYNSYMELLGKPECKLFRFNRNSCALNPSAGINKLTQTP